MEAAGGSKSKADAASGGGVETSAAAEISMTPAAAGTKTTKLVKVHQPFINMLLVRPKIDIRYGAGGRNLMDAVAEVRVGDPKVERLRAEVADTVAWMHKLNDMYADILAQYKEKGYAMVEVEVTEDGRERLVCTQ